MPIRTVTISAGSHTYLPKNSKVILITKTGEATPSSECLNLSEIGLKCWKFFITQGDEKVFDVIYLGSSAFNFSTPRGDDELTAITNELNTILPEGLRNVISCTTGPSSTNVIAIQIPANLDAPRLGFSDNDGDFGQDANRGFLIADADADCTTCP